MLRTILILIFFLPALQGSAQTRARMHIGISGYSLGGEDGLDVSPVLRLSGGGGLGMEIGRGFTIAAEVSYAVHGGQTSGTIDGFSRQGEPIQIPVDATIDLTYVEIPLLLGYGFDLRRGYRLEFGAGPAFGFNLDASMRFSAETGPEFDQDILSTPKRIFGLAFAADLIVPIGSERIAVGLRGWQSRTRAGLEQDLPGRSNLRSHGVTLVTAIVF